MIVGSEQWISQSVLAVAIGVPVPASFVAIAISVAIAIALLAMVTTASTLHLLLEATQSIKRGMSECMSMAGSSLARACTEAAAAGMMLHEMASVRAVLERFLCLSGGGRVKEVQN